MGVSSYTIMAIVLHYLPHRDPLIAHLADNHEGGRFYDVMRTALDQQINQSLKHTPWNWSNAS